MNSKEKGNLALASAIKYYTDKVCPVSIPMSESTTYDLVVDKNKILYKIQCKYVGCKNKRNKFSVPLRVLGGNQSYHTAKYYNIGDFDILFVQTSDGDMYEIPADIALKNRSSIALNESYEIYKINSQKES